MKDLPHILVPLTLFLAATLVICAWLWLNYRAKVDLHETLRRALELGQPLDPEALRTLTSRNVTPYSDLRGGTIATSIGVALFVAAFAQYGIAQNPASASDTGMIGLVFCGVGIGRLLAWKLSPKENNVNA